MIVSAAGPGPPGPACACAGLPQAIQASEWAVIIVASSVSDHAIPSQLRGMGFDGGVLMTADYVKETLARETG
jgi:hypothetical protein